MNIKFVITIAVFFLCSSSMCKKREDEGNYKLKISNKSDVNITWILGHGYPDTTLNDYKLWEPRPWEDDIISPNSTGSVYRQDEWEKIFTEEIPSDTLMVFIFNADTFYNIAWTKIQTEYKVLTRYDLSLEDLENQNWIITYP